jgi:hypothetical protein
VLKLLDKANTNTKRRKGNDKQVKRSFYKKGAKEAINEKNIIGYYGIGEKHNLEDYVASPPNIRHAGGIVTNGHAGIGGRTNS